MRIWQYLIGTITGVLAFASVASADVTALSIDGSNVTPAKQDPKKRGPASVLFQSNETHAGILTCPDVTATTPACYAYPPSTQSVIAFPTDFKFTPGNLVDCNLSAILGKSTAGAKAACPKSIVGQGATVIRTTDGRTLNGTITAFNGAPSGGKPSLYLHVDVQDVGSKLLLSGVISGNVLTVQTPPVSGAVTEHFDVRLNKVVTQRKKNRKTGKVEKKYYFMAKCSTGIWSVTETITYENGKQLSDGTTQTCKKKKK